MTRRHAWNDRDKKGTDVTVRKRNFRGKVRTDERKKDSFTNQIRTVGSKGADLYILG